MGSEILVDVDIGAPHKGGGPQKLFITEDDEEEERAEGERKGTPPPATTTPTAQGEEAVDGQTLSHCVRPKPREREPAEDTKTPISSFTEEDHGGLSSSSSSRGGGGGIESGLRMEDLVLGGGVADGEEGVLSKGWKDRRNHIFILSESGKPIYSRWGSEEELVTLLGVVQALVSFVQDSGDALKSIVVGEVLIVVQVKTPLILVAVSRDHPSVPQLNTTLTYFYNQIVSILTGKQLVSIFEKRRNYDLRRLLGGSERLLDNLGALVEGDAAFLLGAVKCLPLAPSLRDTISSTIATTLAKLKQNIVFGILLAQRQLVSLVRMKKCFMHPMDLHLIINLIDASESFKTAETWSPICLPKFDSSGFVHAHVSYLTDECQACLVLLTVDRESFFPLSEAKQRIVERLKRHNCLEAISASMHNPWPTMSFVGIGGEVRHFLYKSRGIAQFTSPALEPPYAPPPGQTGWMKGAGAEERGLLGAYARLHARLHAPSRPVKLLYLVGERENLLGWTTSTFELYVAFEPLVKKAVAIAAVNRLLKWIKKEEDRVFILNSPTF